MNFNVKERQKEDESDDEQNIRVWNVPADDSSLIPRKVEKQRPPNANYSANKVE